jgi:hypothetical protein
MTPQYLKPDEAGTMIEASPRRLANWQASGYGPPWRQVGGETYVRWLEAVGILQDHNISRKLTALGERILAKQREGEVRDIELRWNGAYMRAA